jgi:hypothetical protein
MGKKKTRSTEPRPVPDLFVTAVTLDGTAEFVRLTGWVAHSTELAPEADGPERRIVARLVMPQSTARELQHGLRRKLPQGDGQ